jgi:hypothetical protein
VGRRQRQHVRVDDTRAKALFKLVGGEKLRGVRRATSGAKTRFDGTGKMGESWSRGLEVSDRCDRRARDDQMRKVEDGGGWREKITENEQERRHGDERPCNSQIALLP